MRLYDNVKKGLSNGCRSLKSGLCRKVAIGALALAVTVPNTGCYYLIKGDYNLVKAVTFREDKEGYKAFGKDALIVGVVVGGGMAVGGGGGGWNGEAILNQPDEGPDETPP